MAPAKKQTRPKPPKAVTPNPIPTVLLRVFQLEIANQCEFGLRAAGDLFHGRDPWYAAQNLLGAVGNISKALWGPNLATRKARKPLRDSLAVTEPNVLETGNVRNHWEHFDERLDEWWRDSTQHNYVDRNIGPVPAGQMAPGSTPVDVFRNFDTATGELAFWGDTFNVPAMVRELDRLYLTAKAESAKPHSDRQPPGAQA